MDLTIGRIWRGWTRPENADEYERLLKEEIFPGIADKGVPGYSGIQLFRGNVEGGEVEFVTIMRFDSWDAVKRFAGEDHERAPVPPKAREVLARFDERSRHYEIKDDTDSLNHLHMAVTSLAGNNHPWHSSESGENRRGARPGEDALGSGSKKPMPFASNRHHEFWTADVRYLDMLDESLLAGDIVYALTIMDNHSRAILSSALTRRQDLNAFLSVLFRAVQEYGPPEAFVTDSGSIFLANRARAIYGAPGIRKLVIENGQPWQSYLETARNVQEHHAHRHRKQGRRSPSEILSWVKTPRFKEEDLAAGVLFCSLYAHPRRPRLPRPPALQALRRGRARRDGGRRVGSRGQPDRLVRRGGALPLRGRMCPAAGVGAVGRLRRVKAHALFETSVVVPQLRLFDLGEALGEEGWAKFLKLDEYAPRRSRRPDSLQQTLFPYTEAI